MVGPALGQGGGGGGSILDSGCCFQLSWEGPPCHSNSVAQVLLPQWSTWASEEAEGYPGAWSSDSSRWPDATPTLA